MHINSLYPRLLLVDDRKENLMALQALLETLNVDIDLALSGEEALGLLLKNDYSLVLLDVQMPEMDGFETAELMRGNKKTQSIPIIFVTAISKEEQYIFKGYESTYNDHIVDNFEDSFYYSPFKNLPDDLTTSQRDSVLKIYMEGAVEGSFASGKFSSAFVCSKTLRKAWSDS